MYTTAERHIDRHTRVGRSRWMPVLFTATRRVRPQTFMTDHFCNDDGGGGGGCCCCHCAKVFMDKPYLRVFTVVVITRNDDDAAVVKRLLCVLKVYVSFSADIFRK